MSNLSDGLQEKLINKVETFVCILLSSKDHLEATQKSAYKLLKECHITVIIEKKKKKLQELDEACQSSKDIFNGKLLEDSFERWSIFNRFLKSMHFFLSRLGIATAVKLVNNSIVFLLRFLQSGRSREGGETKKTRGIEREEGKREVRKARN